jgi:hypothetical protein
MPWPVITAGIRSISELTFTIIVNDLTVRFGSLADLFGHSSLMSAFESIADADQRV